MDVTQEVIAGPVAGRWDWRTSARAAAGSPWLRFLVRRIAGLVGVLLVLAVVVFLLVRLTPGDPAVAVTGGHATAAQLQTVRHQLGLDTSLGHQFATYLKDLSHGDLGNSYTTHTPVRQVISERLGSSLQLAGAGLALMLLLGIPLGLLAGALTRDGRHRRFGTAFTAVTSVGGNVPPYVLATLLVFIFAVTFTLLPVSGSGNFESLILPGLAVGLPPAAVMARVVRVDTLNVLREDYMRTARSKRLSPWRVFVRHALPNVLTSALTIAGIIFGSIIAGAVVVEAVFARAGLGTALVTAVTARDYPTVQGITLILGTVVVIVNATVDLLIALLDPRSLTREP
jgi:peptide/nickel transport system permease protein